MLRTRVRVGVASGLLISVLFAGAFTLIRSFELFIPQLEPSFGSPTPIALRVPRASRVVLDQENVVIEHYSVAVARGTVLDRGSEAHRWAVAHAEAQRPLVLERLGSAFALYLIACLLLTTYFNRFGHPRLKLMRSQLGVMVLMTLMLATSKALLIFTTLPVFWLPLSMVALWTASGFDRRSGVLVDVALSFMAASQLQFDPAALTVFIVRGITVTLLFINKKQSRQMPLAGLAGGAAALAAHVALGLLFQGAVALRSDLSLGVGSEWIACVAGGLVSGLVANLLRGPAERALGHVSRARLLDLTDIESPLLRKMASEAPGSWEHSRAMANLAEAGAAAIGADPLLTRVGAYHHDLGKTVQPKYFVENLAPGERSPHDDLRPDVSADAIMAHVVLGTKILREGGIPEPVVEFAYTHHGTQLVEFFWNKYQQAQAAGSGKVLEESHFRYPGMKPLSRETAILMLVDSIEAASRTIQPPDKKKFEEMIQRVVFHKLGTGQLDDSGLTLTDLRLLTERMASTLVNMYHGRIKYPWQRERDSQPVSSRQGAGVPEGPGESHAAPLAPSGNGADADRAPIEDEPSHALELRTLRRPSGPGPLPGAPTKSDPDEREP